MIFSKLNYSYIFQLIKWKSTVLTSNNMKFPVAIYKPDKQTDDRKIHLRYSEKQRYKLITRDELKFQTRLRREITQDL